MSKFLAPIHSWLFNKIKLYENLEKDIINDFKADPNMNISKIIEMLDSSFEKPLGDAPIEEIIDVSNIHGWLQNRIKIAEIRHAFLITNILNEFGHNALEKMKESYKSQGKSCGKEASEKYNTVTPFELFNALNNYILEGMPCDSANSVCVNEENVLEWRTVKDLHKDYWDAVNGDAQVFYELRKVWISSFVEAANFRFKYTFEVKFLNEVKLYSNNIVLK